ncbi:MAG: hypothetical protein IJK97_02755 [Thermoguttaceae bacterium]|nr:hypothetical protein [Thermoguttaceae bacterium]MBR0192880.1 hypothetical protein [Thermoguttaceae bacterium]
MSTNPLPDTPQPQYVTLSPDWSALLKIGRAYQLLYQFNLIWLLLTAGFCVVMAVLAVTHFADLEKKYQDFRVTVEEKMKAGMKVELEFSPAPEAAIEFQSTELADPAEESEPPFSVFKEEKFLESLDEPLLMVLCLFFLVSLVMFLCQIAIQIVVLVRFANCPNSIVPGGHGVGVAYAICTGLALLLGAVSAVQVLFSDEIPCLLGLAALILFLFFSRKIAVAVHSWRSRLWLVVLILSIFSFFVVLVIAGILELVFVVAKIPEFLIWGTVVVGIVSFLAGALIWFSFLMLCRSLGRDVPLFIEAAMADYSGRMNEQR